MSNESSTSQADKWESQYAELKKELIEIAGILEKYPEALRPKVFDVLLNAYRGKLAVLSTGWFPEVGNGEEHPSVEPKVGAQGGTEGTRDSKLKKRAVPDTYSIDPDLNLHGADNLQSFEKFVGEKKPNSNAEFNAVAVYYVTRILKKPRASLRDAWTCYKDVKRRTPDFFKQSFTDTKNKTGFIKITDEFELEISGRGENFVEHDLPPKATLKS